MRAVGAAMDIVHNEQHRKEMQEAEEREARSQHQIIQLRDEIKQRFQEIKQLKLENEELARTLKDLV